HRIIGQVFADLLENARVRALVTARAVPAMLAFGFVWEITEPAAVLLAPVAAPARVPCGRHVAFRGIVARQVRVRLPVHALGAPGAVLARIAPAQRAVPPVTATLVPVGGISIAMSSHVCLLRAGRLLRSGADVAAAVDVDDLAGNERGFLACEEDVGRPQFAGLPRALEQGAGAEFGHLLCAEAGRDQRRPDRAGRHAIDADAAVGE